MASPLTRRHLANPELTVAPGNTSPPHEGGRSRTEYSRRVFANQLFLVPGNAHCWCPIAEPARGVAQLGKEVEEALEGLRFRFATAVRKAFSEHSSTEKRRTAQSILRLRRRSTGGTRRVEGVNASDFETVKSRADVIMQRAFALGRGQLRRPAQNSMDLMGVTRAPLKSSARAQRPSEPYKDGFASHWQWRATRACVRVQCKLTSCWSESAEDALCKPTRFCVRPSIEYTPREEPTASALSEPAASGPIWTTSKGEIDLPPRIRKALRTSRSSEKSRARHESMTSSTLPATSSGGILGVS